MTTYTAESKQILRDDITFIDSQLELARRHMAEGDKAEAWSILDSLLGYFDFKKHFPDILVNENESIKFQDMYEALRDIDDIIEIDAINFLTGSDPYDWRPGYSREEILRRLQAFINQIDAWLALDWFEGDEITESLERLKEKILVFIRFFENFTDGFLFREALDVKEAKKLLWRAFSDDLPFAEIYKHLLSMDRDLTYLVFKFRLHLDDVTQEMVDSITRSIEEYKHAILAIINATRAEGESVPLEPPTGWDDLLPFPPPGWAMLGNYIVPIRSSRGQIASLLSAGTGVFNIGKTSRPIKVNIPGLIAIVVATAVITVVATLVIVTNC